MIFMGVGEKQAGDVMPLFFNKGDVGKDHIDARFGLAPERHAHIDNEPFARALAAIAVKVKIHADLAHTAKR